MRIPFRQGLVRVQTPTFVQVSGSCVNLQAINTPTLVSVSHGSSEYLITEPYDVANAWGPFSAGTDYWLYWDIDLTTAARTFGSTTVQPSHGATAPTSPINNQHWFDTTEKVMKVWNSTYNTWVKRLRVFATKLTSGTVLVPYTVGTQVAINTEIATGSILFDGTGKPLKKSSGEFFTSEDTFVVANLVGRTFKLENAVVEAIAQENIASYQVVYFSGFGKVNLADYDNVSNQVVAIATSSATTNTGISLVVQGIVTNTSWSWPTVGASLWVQNGLLTTTDPHISDPLTYPDSAVPVARVLASDTIIFEQGLGGKGETGPTGPQGSGASDASTTVKGVAKLSVAPVSAADPIACGTNDPRLSDARTPTTHVHTATTVTSIPTGAITAINVQNAIQQLEQKKLPLTGGTMEGSISMGLYKITNVGDATAATDALNRQTGDIRYIPASGGTMAGYLALVGDPLTNLHAAPKQYVDTSVGANTTEINNIETSLGSAISGTGTWVGFTGTSLLDATTSATGAFTALDTAVNKEAVIHEEILSSGLISGGVLTDGGSNVVNVGAGAGYINTGTEYKRVTWGSTSVATVAPGINHIMINELGVASAITGVHPTNLIHLGHAYSTNSNTDLLEIFSTGEYIGGLSNGIYRLATNVLGTSVVDGCAVSEDLITPLTLDIADGVLSSSLQEYTLPATSTFTKLYNTSDLGWVADATNPNQVNTTQWNNTALPAASALVTMTSGWWKKDIVLRLTNGNVYYIFGQQEYKTYDQASASAIPLIDQSIVKYVAVLAEIIVHQGATTVAEYVRDIRPTHERSYGYGVDANTGLGNGFALAGHEHGVGGYTNSSTGLLVGGQVTINGIDNTKFDVSAGTGIIVDNTTDPLKPSHTLVSWPAMTAVTVTNLGTQPGTHLALDETGAIVQSATPFTYEQTRTLMPLAFLFHGTLTHVVAVHSNVSPAFDPAARLTDLINSMGIINVSGNVYSANGANRKLNKTTGISHNIGANFHVNKKIPDVSSDPLITQAAWQYSYRNGTGSFTIVSGVTDIDTTNYDNGTGTLAAIPAGNWVSIPIFYVPGLGTAGTRVQYPQNVYTTKDEALLNTPDPAYVVNPNLDQNGSVRAYLVVQQGCTNLSNTAQAVFIRGGKFTGTIGGQLGSGNIVGGAPADASYLVTVSNPTLSNEKVIGTDFFVTNSHVQAAAGIVESKLTLNYPTHSNANDPTTTQKEALSGTAGSPSNTNRYVTDSDTRLSNSVAHIASTSNPHSTSVANLIDTTIATPINGHVLYYSTGKWVNAAPGVTSGVQSHGTILDALKALSGNAFVVKTASGTVAARTITGTSNQVTITNGDGIAADPVVAIASNPILPGTGSVTLPSGATAQRPTPTAGMIRYNSTLDSFEGYQGGVWSRIGLMKQMVTTTIPAATNTTSIPLNGSAPLVTEGTQVATLSITPVSTTHKVKLEAAFSVDRSVTNALVVIAVFRDSTCIAVKIQGTGSSSPTADASEESVSIILVDAPATTSTVTYTIRVGVDTGSTGSWYVNNNAGGDTLGGLRTHEQFILTEIGT